jgi:hypothetical protein
MKKVDVIIFFIVGLVVLGVYTISTIGDFKGQLSLKEGEIDNLKSEIYTLKEELDKYKETEFTDKLSTKEVQSLFLELDQDITIAIMNLQLRYFDSYNKNKIGIINKLNLLSNSFKEKKDLFEKLKNEINNPSKQSDVTIKKYLNQYRIFYHNQIKVLKKMEEEAFYGKKS